MTQLIQMTTDQLKAIIEQLNVNAATAGVNAALALKSKGSFSNCGKYFSGTRDYKDVEEFIANILLYKEIEMISDEDALKSLPLLFYGTATTWWEGICREVKTWNEVISLIRDNFSPAKAAYQIYLELFKTKQNNKTEIDAFVYEKRALLARLPEGRHDEETQLDFIYSLLNIKYRKHILRPDIQTFQDLLEKGRLIDQSNIINEEDQENDDSSYSKPKKRCKYCHFRGHTKDECRKRQASRQQQIEQN